MQQDHQTANANLPRRFGADPFVVICQTILVVVFSMATPGCVTPWEKYALMKDTSPRIEKIAGPTERRLRLKFWERQQAAAAEDVVDEDGSLKPLPGTEDFLAATELYKDESYEEAQKAFKKVAKKYKKSDIREDALFMQAESAFQRGHYSKAHDVYAVLLKEFPSTRHLDTVSERLFKIGRLWLNFPEVATLDEIKQVNFDQPKKKLPAEEPPEKNKTPIFIPNLRDKERPLFDTPGNGVAALQAIWMNDPTGPLADDAMMLVASHHSRQGNYVEADRHFRMLRETFPNSPHLQDAFLLGSHVKLMSYQGADYDGKTLSDAEMLKQSTIRLYPNIPEADRLRDELAKIELARADREWNEVQLWLRKGNKRAASVKCHQLISKFPESPQAELARASLEEMGPGFASGAILLNPQDPPKQPLWRRAMGLYPSEAEYAQVGPPVARPSTKDGYAEDPKKEKAPSRWPSNPFRRRTAPSKDPVDEANADPAMESDDAGDGKPVDPETDTTPRKRGWFWPAPRKLPEGSEGDARKLDVTESPGRSKL